MVYAPQRPQTPLAAANRAQRHAKPAYDLAMRLLPAQQRDAIAAYVQGLHAEGAARRNENDRLRAALDSRTRGTHHTENGAHHDR